MKVPFVDLKNQYLSIKSEIDLIFLDIFENTAFICGKYVSLFEKDFAKAHQTKHFVTKHPKLSQKILKP